MLHCPRRFLRLAVATVRRWTNRAPAILLATTCAIAMSSSSLFLTSCGDRPLDLDDLTAPELEFVTRFVVLERARAVALAAPTVGTALLDSLAAAWGDSANVRARDQVPADPTRAAAVYDLLTRILTAEADSLVQAPVARRLTAPLPRGAQLVPVVPAVPPVDEG